MQNEDERTAETLKYTKSDYRSGVIGFYQRDLDHLAEHHPDMTAHMDAIYDTLKDPDIVSYDLSDHASTNGQHFFKRSASLPNPNHAVKVVVAYEDSTWARGHFVTAHKISVKQLERVPDANKIYKADRTK